MTLSLEQKLVNIHHYGLDVENREVYLHSHISETEDTESGVDYRSAIVFEKNIRYLNCISNDPILVHMHMPGGVWEDCLSIFDTIKLSQSNIGILAYTKVESASSVIFQSAKQRILMPNAYILIHYGSLSIDNEHKAAMSSLQWNEKETNKMINIFTDRCMDSAFAQEKNWKKLMAKKHIQSQLANKSDWILDAEEAVKYGFADGVFGVGQFQSIDHIKRKLKKSCK